MHMDQISFEVQDRPEPYGPIFTTHVSNTTAAILFLTLLYSKDVAISFAHPATMRGIAFEAQPNRDTELLLSAYILLNCTHKLISF
jgi:hypothetical protein